MTFRQTTIELPAKGRGVHLVTDEVLSRVDLEGVEVGMVHLFLQHTSASLTINENASPDVRGDFERFFRRLVPDGADWMRHTIEGPDDMPAHLKASLLGPSLMLPVRRGRVAFGTWQGIYLCEHREDGGPRSIVATVWGQADAT